MLAAFLFQRDYPDCKEMLMNTVKSLATMLEESGKRGAKMFLRPTAL